MTLRARLATALLVVVLAPSCSEDTTNPFDQFSFSRAPGPDAILLYVSGAWASEPDAPRELYALNADGTTEQLTTCTRLSEPCDFLQVAPSSDPSRVIAVRGLIGGDPAATALYFVDLGRSVETIILASRRVQAADWSFDDTIVGYSAGDVENLGAVEPNGADERLLTDTPFFRERSIRLAFDLSTAVYEGLDTTPGKSGIYFLVGDTSVAPEPIVQSGPGTEVLPGTPYIVGSNATPAFAPDQQSVVFRRLTGTGNDGLGTWDMLTTESNSSLDEPRPVAVGGDVFRGAPDWGLYNGRIVFVETDTTTGVSSMVSILPDGTDRQVLHSEDAGFRMGAPRWIQGPAAN
jgi:hypothetical protein